jgi:hypothetical protein
MSLKEQRAKTLRNMSKLKIKRNSARYAQVNLFSSLNIKRGSMRRGQEFKLVEEKRKDQYL